MRIFEKNIRLLNHNRKIYVWCSDIFASITFDEVVFLYTALKTLVLLFDTFFIIKTSPMPLYQELG